MVALLVSAAYCAVTGSSDCGFWFGAIEMLIVSLLGVLLWKSCAISQKYNSAIIGKMGIWYYVILILLCIIIGFGLCFIGAAIFGCFEVFVTRVALKLFCLFISYSAVALGSVLKTKLRLEPHDSHIEIPQAPQSAVIDCISIKSCGSVDIVDIKDVVFLKAEGDYVNIVTTRGKFFKEQTMKYFTESLPKDSFIRIHRSYIINTQYLQSIEKYGDYSAVLMTGGEKIRISASGYKILKDRFKL